VVVNQDRSADHFFILLRTTQQPSFFCNRKCRSEAGSSAPCQSGSRRSRRKPSMHAPSGVLFNHETPRGNLLLERSRPRTQDQERVRRIQPRNLARLKFAPDYSQVCGGCFSNECRTLYACNRQASLVTRLLYAAANLSELSCEGSQVQKRRVDRNTGRTVRYSQPAIAPAEVHQLCGDPGKAKCTFEQTGATLTLPAALRSGWCCLGKIPAPL
jgi:hypothetical protein